MSQCFKVSPGGQLQGRVAIPGDKSISHRAIMLASLAQGSSRITGFLESADCLATLKAFAAMGVVHERQGDQYLVHGRGLHGLEAPAKALDLGNSGTSMRLMAGLLAGQRFASTMTGDASLSRRPMNRIMDPLRLMGAAIDGREGGRAPLHIAGNTPLSGIDYTTPVASAQIKSCVLLAGLYAKGATCVEEPGISRDHTERMLGGFGLEVQRDPARRTVSLIGGQSLQATDVVVPGDLSSAAFFMVGALIAPNSDIIMPGVGINATRRGIIDILWSMGAAITLHNERQQAGEPVADIRVRSTALKAVTIGAQEVALAIDECPALFVAAACARGTTRISGAGELRVKECDRIAVMAEGLSKLGIECHERQDGMIIVGKPQSVSFTGARIASHEDHRIVMSFAMAALRAEAEIVIDDCDYVDASFPAFLASVNKAGLIMDSSETEQ